jgi:Tol biopolymer transport system component
MGEVYNARDTRLDRAVAVKILSPEISGPPEVRQRFEREARAISQLSHPNICALFDVGNDAGTEFLVMELLEGETIANRLARGPLPLDQVLRYGGEISSALDKAHRAGIVHRDLKPANVMITKAGVKLLDFGLAKTMAPIASVSAGTMTAARPLTARGAVAGTVQYMSPEQLEGRPVDARSDLFALGAVIYEMATGQKAFRTTLKPLAPAALDRLVRVCLADNPDDRYQSAHDVGLQLAAIAADGNVPALASPGGTARWMSRAIVAAVLVAAVATVVFAALRPSRVPTPIAVTRFPLPPPSGGGFLESPEVPTLAVSPDGSRIAFAAFDASGVLRLWIRDVAALDATAIPGTDGATSMFWAPDGRLLAFIAGDKLKRLDVAGGAPVTICDVRPGIDSFGTWGRDGQILFASVEGEAIFRVAASGGVPTVWLKPDAARGEARFNWPTYLPDGRRVLFLQRRKDGSGQLMLADPGTPPRALMPLQSKAQYVDPGYLVFAADGALVGRRFDLARGEVTGDPFSIAPSVGYFFSTTVARFAASLNGTLVYQSHHNEQRLVWFDRTGKELGAIGARGEYKNPRLSPDERRVAFDRMLAGAYDVWAMDLERQAETRLTLSPSSEGVGPWTPDGRTLFFNADHGAPPQIFRKDLATGAEQLALPAGAGFQEPSDISPDGKTLLYLERTLTGNDIWMWPLDGSHPPSVVVQSPFDEEDVRFSPDGRFFSFISNESGSYDVYLSPFPPVGEKTRISTAGGWGPRWDRRGGGLVYEVVNGLMTVPVQTSPSLRVGNPVRLFEFAAGHPWGSYDVSSQGQFLAVVSESRSSRQPFTVVINWPAELDRGPQR